MKYIRVFPNSTEFNEAYSWRKYIEPWLSVTTGELIIKYNKKEEDVYNELKATPLTFIITSSGTVSFGPGYPDETAYRTIEYKLNDGEWTEYTSTYNGQKINVQTGDIISFRGDNTSNASNDGNFSNSFVTTCNFTPIGNIMSMMDSTNFANLTTITGTRTFQGLFSSCTRMTDASQIILPATTLSPYCYRYLFQRCTGLTKFPKLPATTMASYCYSGMFSGCTGMT